jgi:hypothetical protein
MLVDSNPRAFSLPGLNQGAAQPMPLRLQKPNLPQAVYWFTLLAFVLRMIARLHTGAADFWVNDYVFFLLWPKTSLQERGLGLMAWRQQFEFLFTPSF